MQMSPPQLQVPASRLKKIALAFLVISALGFLDATFLTAEHFLDKIPPCTIVSGCATVTTSSYSEIFGIPVALGGAVYYLTVFIIALLYRELGDVRVLRGLAWGTIVGLVATSWFLYLQAFVLNAYCIYCLGSALTSLALFALGLVVLRRITSEKF